MAGSSFFALLDDIATIMDDVAVLSKVTAKKTSGVVGDDLALNANQVAGVSSSRELPVVYQAAKGSLVNKAIIVPCALIISYFAPWLVTPLLMIGGIYLCYEGAEKIIHSLMTSNKEKEQYTLEHKAHLEKSEEELISLEKEKIKGAVRTDFILSAEIIVIALGIVANYPLLTRTLALSTISLFMTIFVYGLVACIVKLDDLGLYLLQKKSMVYVGKALLFIAPYIMKLLSIAGTVAMFLVGGGILVHGNEMISSIAKGNIFAVAILEGLAGVFAGVATAFIILLLKKLKVKPT